MTKKIPVCIVRKAIYDVLIERGNAILEEANETSKQEIKQTGVSSEYSGELETTSCGTYVLADDVLSGEISIKEAFDEILTPEEKVAVADKCLKLDCSVVEL